MASLCPANLRHRPLLLQSTSRSSAVARIAARPLGAAPFPRRPVKVTQAQPNYGQPSYGQPYGQQDPKYPNIYQSPYEATPPAQEPPEYAQRAGSLLSEEEERDRLAVGTALRNIGWLSFWSQLTLTIISGVILLFSIGITNQGVVNLNFINIATLVGVVGSFISTFLAWSFVQAGRRLGMLQEVKLSKVEGTVLRGTTLNLLGLGATLVGLQATVGGLVAKTLSSAAAGPAVYAGRAGSAPPVALDVFSVQACTNTVLAHFLAIAFSNWLLRVLNKYIQKETQQQGPSQPPTPTLV